jgi:hypothetical protein
MNRTSIKVPVFRKSVSIIEGSPHCLSGIGLEALHALGLCLSFDAIFLRIALVHVLILAIDNFHLAFIQLGLLLMLFSMAPVSTTLGKEADYQQGTGDDYYKKDL